MDPVQRLVAAFVEAVVSYVGFQILWAFDPLAAVLFGAVGTIATVGTLYSVVAKAVDA